VAVVAVGAPLLLQGLLVCMLLMVGLVVLQVVA
jgi:hypothetical protein